MKLLPYQIPMRNYLNNNRSAALFAEMRLGKTVCTIEAFKNHHGKKLVVCPKSVIPSWLEKIPQDGSWTVTNYEALKKVTQLPDIIVVDESVRMKNPKAQITKLLLSTFRYTRHKVILSGNPAPNTPLEYFTQMQFLYDKWMGCGNYWQFRNRYFTTDYMGFQWYPKPNSKILIRQALRKDAYQVTRNQVGMRSDKIYEKRIIEMPPKLQKMYKKMEEEFALTLPDGQELETDHVLAQLVYLQQLANGFISKQDISDFKVQELVELLRGELRNEPVVIWTNYRWEQEMLASALEDFIPKIINGDTSIGLRELYQNRFQQEETGILIISESCGKYGLDLSRASTCIYFSNSYSLDDRVQSEERIFNITKKSGPLLYIDLITKNSIQEDILKVLRRKTKDTKYFLGEILSETRNRTNGG